jgi:hypothetical protein
VCLPKEVLAVQDQELLAYQAGMSLVLLLRLLMTCRLLCRPPLEHSAAQCPADAMKSEVWMPADAMRSRERDG